jgi:hypothetical protein
MNWFFHTPLIFPFAFSLLSALRSSEPLSLERENSETMATWGVALSPGTSSLMQAEEKREGPRAERGKKDIEATAAMSFGRRRRLGD